MILDQIKTRLKEAMKSRSQEKDILRVFLGKLQQIEADEGTAKVTDDRSAAVAKSLIKGNQEAITTVEGATPPADWAETKAKLEAEIATLQSFLPTYLSPEQVTVALSEDADTLEKIRKANNDGAATGVAMKYLKAKDLKVEGNIVKDVVGAIRRQG